MEGLIPAPVTQQGGREELYQGSEGGVRPSINPCSGSILPSFHPDVTPNLQRCGIQLHLPQGAPGPLLQVQRDAARGFDSLLSFYFPFSHLWWSEPSGTLLQSGSVQKWTSKRFLCTALPHARWEVKFWRGWRATAAWERQPWGDSFCTPAGSPPRRGSTVTPHRCVTSGRFCVECGVSGWRLAMVRGEKAAAARGFQGAVWGVATAETCLLGTRKAAVKPAFPLPWCKAEIILMKTMETS